MSYDFFVDLLVKNTCTENSADWITAVIHKEGGRNLPGRDSYFTEYRSHKADDILSRLQPMQRIYYRFCLVREIMLKLSTYTLELFQTYIFNTQQNPDSIIKDKMNLLFSKSRLGTGGVVPMTLLQSIDVGLTNFNITETEFFTIPVEKIRLNFFFNVWEFIYMFKLELELGLDLNNRDRISSINYIFPIFDVPIGDVGLFSPNYLKTLMKRIQEETQPLTPTRQTNYQTDNDVDRSYKYDLLQISRLYYESLKKDVDTLEKELSGLLQEFAYEYKDNDTKSTKTSKDPKNRMGPRRNLGGSKTRRKQRRRKQKSRTKKN